MKPREGVEKEILEIVNRHPAETAEGARLAVPEHDRTDLRDGHSPIPRVVYRPARDEVGAGARAIRRRALEKGLAGSVCDSHPDP